MFKMIFLFLIIIFTEILNNYEENQSKHEIINNFCNVGGNITNYRSPN
jgi:hypothetical protein